MNPFAQISVDRDKCVHTLQCTYHAPEFFDVDDNGEMTHADEVPASGEDAVHRAAELCPSLAITLTRAAR